MKSLWLLWTFYSEHNYQLKIRLRLHFKYPNWNIPILKKTKIDSQIPRAQVQFKEWFHAVYFLSNLLRMNIPKTPLIEW